MLVIDGSQGEGGGQVLRSSLALSIVTQTPFCIEKIRAGRRRPGLLRQHLTAVRAAAAISGAELEGDELGSKRLRFSPGPVRAGSYSFDIGSAGSTGLVLQTIAPPLALAGGPSCVEIRGGTHNSASPPFDFLCRTLFPLVARIGPTIRGTLERPGYYPAGGGRVVFHIEPAGALAHLDLDERGELRSVEVAAVVARLPVHIAERELAVVREQLGVGISSARVHEEKRSRGPGNVVTIALESEVVTEVVTGFGARGVRAESVASGAASEAAHYLQAGVPVGEHLADQLLLWLALAGGGSFRTVAPSLHTRTHCRIIEIFLDRKIQVDEEGAGTFRVSVL